LGIKGKTLIIDPEPQFHVSFSCVECITILKRQPVSEDKRVPFSALLFITKRNRESSQQRLNHIHLAMLASNAPEVPTTITARIFIIVPTRMFCRYFMFANDPTPPSISSYGLPKPHTISYT
jgi:hypothetical protein